jgi:hypothetical protein
MLYLLDIAAFSMPSFLDLADLNHELSDVATFLASIFSFNNFVLALVTIQNHGRPRYSDSCSKSDLPSSRILSVIFPKKGVEMGSRLIYHYTSM